MTRTMVVGLIGGPGSGKSTMMAGVFSDLKEAGVSCEMAPEWIKEACWEGRDAVQDCQPFIWAQQLWRVRRLVGKVDVVLTDSPPILSIVYGNTTPEFRAAVLAEDKAMPAENVYVFVERTKPFDPRGRWQDEATAKALDAKFAETIAFDLSVPGNPSGRAALSRWIIDKEARS